MVALPVAIYFGLAEQASWRARSILPVQNMRGFVVTNDGQKLVVAVNKPTNLERNNGEIHIYDLQTLERIHHLKTGFHSLADVALSLDSKRLAVLGGEGCGGSSAWCGQIQIYDTKNWKLLKMSKVIGEPETIAGFVTPEKVLIQNTHEHIQIWNMKDKEPEWDLNQVMPPHYTFSPQHKLIAWCRYDESLKIMDATTKTLRYYPNIRPQANDYLGPMEFSPDGKRLAIQEKHRIKVWNLQTGKLHHQLSKGRYQDYSNSSGTENLFFDDWRSWPTLLDASEAERLWKRRFEQGQPLPLPQIRVTDDPNQSEPLHKLLPDGSALLSATQQRFYRQRIK